MATNKNERVYTIPLRSDFVKVPKYYRAKRAINNIKRFVGKHMKSEDVRIGSVLNEHVWSRGIKNPPGKVTVTAVKEKDFVTVELEGYTYKVLKVQTEKTEKPTSFKDKLAAKLKQDKKDDDVEEAPEKSSKDDSKEAPKEAPKEEAVKEAPKEDSKDASKEEAVKESPKKEAPKKEASEEKSSKDDSKKASDESSEASPMKESEK